MSEGKELIPEQGSESKMKSTLVMKQEYKKAREEEMVRYYTELAEFCKERNIDINAEVVTTSKGSVVRIFLVDTQ